VPPCDAVPTVKLSGQPVRSAWPSAKAGAMLPAAMSAAMQMFFMVSSLWHGFVAPF